MDGKMIDPELLTFLTSMKNEQIQAVRDSETHIKEMLKLTIDPVKENLKKHEDDIEDLYNKDLEHRARFGMIEADVKNLVEDKEDGKHDKEIRVGIWAIVSTIALAAVGWVVSLFVK